MAPINNVSDEVISILLHYLCRTGNGTTALALTATSRHYAGKLRNSVFEQQIISLPPFTRCYHDFVLLLCNKPYQGHIRHLRSLTLGLQHQPRDACYFLDKETLSDVVKEMTSLRDLTLLNLGWLDASNEVNEVYAGQATCVAADKAHDAAEGKEEDGMWQEIAMLVLHKLWPARDTEREALEDNKSYQGDVFTKRAPWLHSAVETYARIGLLIIIMNVFPFKPSSDKYLPYNHTCAVASTALIHWDDPPTDHAWGNSDVLPKLVDTRYLIVLEQGADTFDNTLNCLGGATISLTKENVAYEAKLKAYPWEKINDMANLNRNVEIPEDGEFPVLEVPVEEIHVEMERGTLYISTWHTPE